MARRRGTIYKKASGLWEAQIFSKDKNKRLSKAFKKKGQAVEWLEKTAAQVDQGLTGDAAVATVKKLLGFWLDAKTGKLRPTTIKLYTGIINNHILDDLGSVRVRDIDTRLIQEFYTLLKNQKVTPRNIELVHTVLHGALSMAERQGMVAKNWASLAEPPRTKKRNVQVWTESQVAHFLANIPGDHIFYRFAFFTGARRGEILGLQWADVDWRAETVTIRHQVYFKPGGGFELVAPKTKKGIRAIRMGSMLLEGLRQQFNQVIPMARELAGEKWQEHDLVFPSSVGTPRQASMVTSRFKQLAKDAGLPVIRFHDIRHTAASLMLANGEPPVRVAGILGQSVAVLHDTYAHYIPDDQSRVAAYMDRIVTTNFIKLNRSADNLQTKDD
jgi:integrase